VKIELAPPETGLVLGEEQLLVKALQTLIETAVKFSSAGETVRLACQPAQDSIQVTMESCGRTIPVPAIDKFFDLFAVDETMTPGGDLGLGAPVAYRILSLFAGSVSVENRDLAGIRLTIRLQRPS